MAATLDRQDARRPDAGAAGTAQLTDVKGMRLLYGGNRVVTVPDAVAEAFRPGDSLVVVQTTGDVLHIGGEVLDVVNDAVRRAGDAFEALTALPDEAIDRFYDAFAAALADDAVWQEITAANTKDVDRARALGRSTTRLVADGRMRARMIEGLRLWRDLPPRREAVQETVEHEGWRVEQVVSGVGVVGFVFEGRPNVFADATGVLRSGNTAVMRIGSDALDTARAISAHALVPALRGAGLPEGAIILARIRSSATSRVVERPSARARSTSLALAAVIACQTASSARAAAKAS